MPERDLSASRVEVKTTYSYMYYPGIQGIPGITVDIRDTDNLGSDILLKKIKR
jgi:uncharacterized protein YggE